MLGKKRINIFHGAYTSADSVQPIYGIALFLFFKNFTKRLYRLAFLL